MPDFYKTHAKEDCPRTGECGWLVIFSPLGMGREQFEGSKTLKEAKREAMRLVIEKLNRIIDSFKDVKV